MTKQVRDVLDDELGASVNRASVEAELPDPDAKVSSIDRVVNRIAEAAGVLILVTIVALVFGNAFGRYMLNSPIAWSDEIVEALMPWLAMSGVFLAVRRRQLIRIEFFVSKFSSNTRSMIAITTCILSASVFIYFAFLGFNNLMLFGGDRTIYLRLPRGWFTSAFSVGAAAVAIAFLVSAWQSRRPD